MTRPRGRPAYPRFHPWPRRCHDCDAPVLIVMDAGTGNLVVLDDYWPSPRLRRPGGPWVLVGGAEAAKVGSSHVGKVARGRRYHEHEGCWDPSPPK